LPVITIFGVLLGFVLGGSVAVEQAFGVPGLGRAMVTAGDRARHHRGAKSGSALRVIFVGVNVLVDLSLRVARPTHTTVTP
jgi:peptide/nickel transport system permease protein